MLAARGTAGTAPSPPGFSPSAWFGEQIREFRPIPQTRAVLLAPGSPLPGRPNRLIVYFTPNGNTVEQTLGCRPGPGLDWRFDIQHVAAQVRRWRELDRRKNLYLACVEAEGLSWPAWRQAHSNAPDLAQTLLARLRDSVPGPSVRVDLAAHSGGGSFLFALLSAPTGLPEWVDRLLFLDANYAYTPGGDLDAGLTRWLDGAPRRRLFVLAYDDRRITLGGRLVVGPTGGTYRATLRMLPLFRRWGEFVEWDHAKWQAGAARRGQVRYWIAHNPDNRILHTALIGEWNGLLHLLTLDRPEEGTVGEFGGPRAYGSWVQDAPISRLREFPLAPSRAPAGVSYPIPAAATSLREREAIWLNALRAGHFPRFLRRFREIRLRGRGADQRLHDIRIWAMPDYVGVGTDREWLRTPLTPQSAQALADEWNCLLPTARVVDAIHAQAEIQLSPRWLTRDREAPATFQLHHRLVEQQRADRSLGRLISGIKKDVVLTNRILERPRRLAIYGWHHGDGDPIQPVSTVHVNTYVDYSHGIRLISREAELDGQPADLERLLLDPTLAPLLSGEEALRITRYPHWDSDPQPSGR